MMKPTLATALLLLAPICVADETIVVDSVISGSPAAAAGLQDGDRIIGLAGQKIATQDDLQKIMGAHQPGDTVALTVQREGETVDLSLTFGERPGGGVSIGVRLAIGRDPIAIASGFVFPCRRSPYVHSILKSMPSLLRLDNGPTNQVSCEIGLVGAAVGTPVAVLFLGETLPQGFVLALVLIVAGAALFQVKGARKANMTARLRVRSWPKAAISQP